MTQPSPGQPLPPPKLDLTKGPPGDPVSVDPYSVTWANVVKPLTRLIFLLLAAVFLIPFLFVFVEDARIQSAAMDWAKTILAPIVGFASASVGYYYGTRQSSANEQAEDQ